MPKSRKSRKYARKRSKTRKLKKIRRGTSKEYTPSGNIINLNETINGQIFFRKSGGDFVEHEIAQIILENPHPNIVNIYRITDEYIDIEQVKPITDDDIANNNYDKDALLKAAESAKQHLQSLGIMYIDWKPDNFGIDKNGTYKLFDFNASGIASSNNTWEIEPPRYWSYKQALASGKIKPINIDNYTFEIGFNTNYTPLDTSEFE